MPLDLGASPVTGMHVSSVYHLRQSLELDPPGTPVKVVEPYQMLGEIDPRPARTPWGSTWSACAGRRTMFGFENKDWKPWTLSDGTPVLVPGAVQHRAGAQRRHPHVSRGRPLARRPAAGCPRAGTTSTRSSARSRSTTKLDVEDNLEEFGPISDADLALLRRRGPAACASARPRAILANFGGTAFGDIALVPAPWLKHPKGIRDIEEWYVSTAARFDYVYEVFRRQCEIAPGQPGEDLRGGGRPGHGRVRHRHRLRHAERPLHQPQGLPQALPAVPPPRERLGPPAHALEDLHPSLRLGAGAVAGHHRGRLRHPQPGAVLRGRHGPADAEGRFGAKITFWGGGVDTQKTLPFGTPEQVRSEVQRRMEIFGRGGGFVFNTVHNVQARTPPENLVALYEAVREYRRL